MRMRMMRVSWQSPRRARGPRRAVRRSGARNWMGCCRIRRPSSPMKRVAEKTMILRALRNGGGRERSCWWRTGRQSATTAICCTSWSRTASRPAGSRPKWGKKCDSPDTSAQDWRRSSAPTHQLKSNRRAARLRSETARRVRSCPEWIGGTPRKPLPSHRAPQTAGPESASATASGTSGTPNTTRAARKNPAAKPAPSPPPDAQTTPFNAPTTAPDPERRRIPN
mmetsp:Transcript_36668/g.89635  ORF Transcript_36668/g.89635 Transcript_36668/m.89635 type:complete len:224 (-) Transcript_36668:2104-2775(-)